MPSHPAALKRGSFRDYLSLILLFIPAVLFALLLLIYRENTRLRFGPAFPFVPWQFFAIALCGIVATIGGVLDWQYHRNSLNMKIPKKEREAEALALGVGGVPCSS